MNKENISLAGLIVAIIAGIFFAVIVIGWGIGKLAPAGMTNQEIVKQTEYCKRHGLKTERYYSGINLNTVRIECRERK